MRLKYMGSKSRLAPHVDRLLGDVGPILCVAQEWLEQSCCQRRIEAAILCPTQDQAIGSLGQKSDLGVEQGWISDFGGDDS